MPAAAIPSTHADVSAAAYDGSRSPSIMISHASCNGNSKSSTNSINTNNSSSKSNSNSVASLKSSNGSASNGQTPSAIAAKGAALSSLSCLTQLTAVAATSLPPQGSKDSPFFRVLTPDLRYQIYLWAFGHRVLHLYLLYRKPLRTGEKWRKGHCPIPPWHEPPPRLLSGVEGDSTPREWAWWSCVCGAEKKALERKLENQCPRGFDFNYDETESLSFLSVLPWLLSCRQALVAISH
jgi:hypothetical protein